MHARVCLMGKDAMMDRQSSRYVWGVGVGGVCISSREGEREGVDVRPGIRWGVPWRAGDRG